MKSIQTKLTLWLIAALAFGSIIALAATYFFARAELRRIFDHELTQIAQAVHLREDWTDAGRIRLARPGFLFSVRAYDKTGRVYFETVQPALPQDVPQTVDDGFTFVDTAEGAWRLYTYVTPEGIVQVGQPVASRVALARDLSLLMLIPLLVLVSLLAVSFSWVLKRGLAPRNVATGERQGYVAARRAAHGERSRRAPAACPPDKCPVPTGGGLVRRTTPVPRRRGA